MACKANKSSCSGRSSKSLIKWINSKAGNQLEMDALRLSSQLEKGGSSGVEGTNSTNMQNSHLHLHSWYVPILFNLLASFFALLWSPAFIVMRIVLLRRSAFGFLKCHLEICLKVAPTEISFNRAKQYHCRENKTYFSETILRGMNLAWNLLQASKKLFDFRTKLIHFLSIYSANEFFSVWQVLPANHSSRLAQYTRVTHSVTSTSGKLLKCSTRSALSSGIIHNF